MKTYLILFAAALSTNAFGMELCKTKISNAASYELAQQVGVPVQGAEVIDYKYGIWTEAMSNNTGFDTVTVKIGDSQTRNFIIKRFGVSAQQVGSTDDCEILSVKELEN